MHFVHSASLNNLEGETGALTLENLKQLFTAESVAQDNSSHSFDLTDEYS